jgi:DUF971 family protein
LRRSVFVVTHSPYDLTMPAPASPPPDDQQLARALDQPINSDQFRPLNLHIDRTAGLRVDWADGQTSLLPLVLLRKNCPCATCRDQRDATTSAQGRSLTILPAGIDRATVLGDAKLVGNYALQITWGDGHSTGIFDFRLLRSLAPTRPTPG